jgi:hypothetical protein
VSGQFKPEPPCTRCGASYSRHALYYTLRPGHELCLRCHEGAPAPGGLLIWLGFFLGVLFSLAWMAVAR